MASICEQIYKYRVKHYTNKKKVKKWNKTKC